MGFSMRRKWKHIHGLLFCSYTECSKSDPRALGGGVGRLSHSDFLSESVGDFIPRDLLCFSALLYE